MKTRVFIFAIAFMGCLAGCTIYSLHPLYSEEVLLFDEDLNGVWIDSDSQHWTIRQALQASDNEIKQQTVSPFTYVLSYAENGKTVELYLHLVRLGNQLFLDYYPTENFDEYIGNGLLAGNLLPVHTFARVEITANELTMYRFNGDWLEDLIDKRKIRISHEEVPFYGGNIKVLTASTEELQKFLIKYQGEEDAYEEPIVLKRKL